MRIVSIFTARELNLTGDGEQFLVEKCEGSASWCFAPFMVLKNEEDINDWYDEGIERSINQALIRTGLVSDKEEVMIDCCW